MIGDFLVSLFGYELGGILEAFLIMVVVVTIVLFPLCLPLLRNTYFIDKMNEKNKRRQKDNFNYQLSKLVGDSKKDMEISECKKEIEELKAEIARLKKDKK